MTEPNSNQQPYQGISGPGSANAPAQGQMTYGAQNPYGQPQAQQPQQPQQPQNPYGQAPNPYGTGGGGGYGPPPRRVRKPVLMYVRLGVLVVVLIISGVSWLVTQSHKSKRNDSGAISKSGNLSADSLRVGDCYDKPTGAETSFSSVKAIPCDQPHNSQVFYTFTFPGATSTPPTHDELTNKAQPMCEDAAKTKIDEEKLPEHGQESLYYGNDATWASGNHEITCVVEGDADFTGSFVKS